MEQVKKSIARFERAISELNMDITDDRYWPVISDHILVDLPQNKHKTYWEQLLILFLEKEKAGQHHHKGLIYWRLAVHTLLEGDISNALEYLRKSRDEDIKKLGGDTSQITASIGLLSVLSPLLVRYKDKKNKWILDEAVKDIYDNLSIESKKEFANTMFESHDSITQGRLWIIKDDFFGFIQDERIRSIVFDTYKEVRDTLLTSNLDTYYSCIFSIGSIVEAMLDDLFTRDEGAVWSHLKSNENIQKQIKPETKLASSKYQTSMNLGEKITLLKLMTNQDISPIRNSSILQIMIIGEYRDLIHPRRRLEFEFDPRKYIGQFLFTMIRNFAGDWWPENVNKRVKTSTDI